MDAISRTAFARKRRVKTAVVVLVVLIVVLVILGIVEALLIKVSVAARRGGVVQYNQAVG